MAGRRNQGALNGGLGACASEAEEAALDGAVVLRVKLELAALAPGVTEIGLKAQVVRAGNPEQESAMALLNAPPRGVTVTVKLADPPRATLALEGEAAMVKSTTVAMVLPVLGTVGSVSPEVTVAESVTVPAAVG